MDLQNVDLLLYRSGIRGELGDSKNLFYEMMKPSFGWQCLSEEKKLDYWLDVKVSSLRPCRGTPFTEGMKGVLF
jgi:hypothetical protein